MCRPVTVRVGWPGGAATSVGFSGGPATQIPATDQTPFAVDGTWMVPAQSPLVIPVGVLHCPRSCWPTGHRLTTICGTQPLPESFFRTSRGYFQVTTPLPPVGWVTFMPPGSLMCTVHVTG